MSAPRPSRAGRALRATALLLPRAITSLRRRPPAERTALVGLVVLSLVLGAGRVAAGRELFPPAVQVLPLLGGALLLRRGSMRVLVAVVAAVLVVDVVFEGVMEVRPGNLATVFLTAVIGYELVESKNVGVRLLRRTYVSVGKEFPLRWRFYFYKPDLAWRLIDLRVDDRLPGIFDEPDEPRTAERQ